MPFFFVSDCILKVEGFKISMGIRIVFLFLFSENAILVDMIQLIKDLLVLASLIQQSSMDHYTRCQ